MFNYDEAYSKPGLYWGRKPNSLCLETITLDSAVNRAHRRAIDLGCGEGRDLIQFAKYGYESVGVDISMPGLKKAEAWAEEEGLVIRTLRSDLIDYRLSEEFDIIYSSGTLTYLPQYVRHDVFSNYKHFTRPGGLNAFNVFVEKPFLATPPDWGIDEHFYISGELLTYYWDWEIVRFEETIFDCNSGGVPHKHAMDVMIARRI
ncbi:MAG TPA: methyltransferase domain-containing protein [Firmicutes bacterium]|nr:methyltransferase domain-containing protein [Bacillota bacterium]